MLRRLPIHRDILKKCEKAPCRQASKVPISSIFLATLMELSMVKKALTERTTFQVGHIAKFRPGKLSVFRLQKPF